MKLPHEEYQKLAKEKLTFVREKDYECGNHVCIYDKGVRIECEDHVNKANKKAKGVC